MKFKSIRLRAGKNALKRIRHFGLQASDVAMMVGASGGPKWFVLHGLDEYFLRDFFKLGGDRAQEPVQAAHPITLLGSSAGAWRFACYAMNNPLAAHNRFTQAYLHLPFDKHSNAAFVSTHSRAMLSELLAADGASILANDRFTLCFIVSQCHGLLTKANDRAIWAGLGLATLANSVHRNWLRAFFSRIIFSTFDSSFLQFMAVERCDFLNPALHRDVPTRNVALTQQMLYDALLACGSIPGAMEIVRHIPGLEWQNKCEHTLQMGSTISNEKAQKAHMIQQAQQAQQARDAFCDGGVLDYHFDMPFCESPESIVLYPHFSNRLVPGWFDKMLPYRNIHKDNYHNVLVISPSDSFVQSLPYGKISDRKDFAAMPAVQRIAYWQRIMGESQRMAQDLHDLIATNRVGDYLEEL
jgi:hypothetical protein